MLPSAARPLHGILNIDKHAGWTSHDVVSRVRRLLGQKAVGHAGTLDPLATGVLLVCVGHATRVAEYLMAGRKLYRATVQLGLATDTWDITGAPIAVAAVPPLGEADLARALADFVGEIFQVPPAYSAIKRDGVPAHRRARRGEIVEMPGRWVKIYGIELLSWQAPYVTFDVTCDPGTYIRSLAHDLGGRLGCGAALAQLRRLQSGRFRAEDALSLDALAEAIRAGEIGRHLHPLRAALDGWTPVPVDDALARRLAHGQPIPCPTAPVAPEGYALSARDEVIALLEYRPAAGEWWPRKVFAANE
ncbi:MAG: tRNA pseudouridine(55) synthase TruB, partial [Anaerolineae bacterium]